MIRCFVAVLLVGSLAACHSSTHRAASAPPTTPKLDVALTDAGLTFSSRDLRAGTYAISFQDRRSHRPAGQKVSLAFGPSGPLIALTTVPAGTRADALLIANMIPWIVVDGLHRDVAGETGFDVSTTKQYPTPAT